MNITLVNCEPFEATEDELDVAHDYATSYLSEAAIVPIPENLDDQVQSAIMIGYILALRNNGIKIVGREVQPVDDKPTAIRVGKSYDVRFVPNLNADEPWMLVKHLDKSISFWESYEALTEAMLEEFEHGV